MFFRLLTTVALVCLVGAHGDHLQIPLNGTDSAWQQPKWFGFGEEEFAKERKESREIVDKFNKRFEELFNSNQLKTLADEMYEPKAQFGVNKKFFVGVEGEDGKSRIIENSFSYSSLSWIWEKERNRKDFGKLREIWGKRKEFRFLLFIRLFSMEMFSLLANSPFCIREITKSNTDHIPRLWGNLLMENIESPLNSTLSPIENNHAINLLQVFFSLLELWTKR